MMSEKGTLACFVVPTDATGKQPTRLPPPLWRSVTMKSSRGSELHTRLVGMSMRCNIRSSHMFLGGASSPRSPRHCSVARLPLTSRGPKLCAPASRRVCLYRSGICDAPAMCVLLPHLRVRASAVWHILWNYFVERPRAIAGSASSEAIHPSA